ncbi:MAG: UPF0182 family protein [Bryobacteraceae bacterium]|nr:UPF0182 family protein [Bryobacteraceae bacterium]
MHVPEIDEYRPKRSGGGRLWIVGVVIALFVFARSIAGYVVEVEWWREVEQLETWFNLLLYGVAPVAVAALAAFAVLWLTHARALKFAGIRLRDYPAYLKLASLGLLVLGALVALFTVDTWTVVRYLGGREISGEAASWRDPVFGQPLGFYFFRLPFYQVLLRLVLALSFVAALLFWVTARFWQLRGQLGGFRGPVELDLRDLNLSGALESRLLRVALAIFLLGLAVSYYLERYDLLAADHGFMVGVDYVAQNITLPLLWAVVAAFVLAAVAALLGRLKIILLVGVVLIVKTIVPSIVNRVYVRPNEISIQRPFIERHIAATRAAYGLVQRTREVEFPAVLEGTFNASAHMPLLENVRLWDWRAFHDTVTQIQALRPYSVFADTDVDRYRIDGRLRQVMLTPRELDVRQLGDARARWINTHFIYTHGYGLVMAEANRITPEGLPVMLIQDAPPKVQTSSLKLTRPELYYGEVTHEPVYVGTAQPEFNYPAGSDNAHTKYEGKGGIPIDNFGVRLAAAVSRSDWNLLLTGYLTPQSRMLIRRDVRDRVRHIAGFLEWENDPYLVLTEEGRLMWIVDGYTTSAAHPYSRLLDLEGFGRINYIRNSVKATVDAYDGTVRLYVFDPADPVLEAYRRLFPSLLQPVSAMPADLWAHARYPEAIFRVQAEIYRTFHMQDPEAFYNKEDLWDVARNIQGQGARPEASTPTYIVASLPDRNEPEFLLVLPFTPRNKDNLIGLMVARNDGDTLGELVFLKLSKNQLVLGPMQVEARINQDQNISKDLTLWNQQGSQVLRGQMLTLPVENTFLYIEPIYIQAQEARMPQLKKVVLAVGNRLIYTDTYEQALAELGAGAAVAKTAASPGEKPPQTAAAGALQPPPDGTASAKTLDTIRFHLRRYRELASQGRWAEAGKELEAVEAAAGRR